MRGVLNCWLLGGFGVIVMSKGVVRSRCCMYSCVERKLVKIDFWEWKVFLSWLSIVVLCWEWFDS